jgi:hypothetical protein
LFSQSDNVFQNPKEYSHAWESVPRNVFKNKKKKILPGMVVHKHNPRTQEAEEGGL